MITANTTTEVFGTADYLLLDVMPRSCTKCPELFSLPIPPQHLKIKDTETLVENMVSVNAAFFKQFPDCEEKKVKQYVTGIVNHAIATHPLASEVEKYLFLPKKTKIQFLFDEGARGYAYLGENKIAINLANFIHDSLKNMANGSLSMTIRHELHHLLMLRINQLLSNCIILEKHKEVWGSTPIWPDSGEKRDYWLSAVAQGLERIETAPLPLAIMEQYTPRLFSITIHKSQLSENMYQVAIKTITDEGIAYFRIPKRESTFLNELLPPNTENFPFYATQIISTNKAYKLEGYSVSINKGFLPERWAFAIVWNIRTVLITQNWIEGNKRQLAEVDAVIAGFPKELLAAAFPEWLAFHIHRSQEADECHRHPEQHKNYSILVSGEEQKFSTASLGFH